jgi:hypothetical protein
VEFRDLGKLGDFGNLGSWEGGDSGMPRGW